MILDAGLETEMKRLAKESFGYRLRQKRMAAGLSQAELGMRVGLSMRMVSYYEAETDQPPPGDVVAKFAKALRTPSDELLGIKPFKEAVTMGSVRLLKRLQRIQRLPRHDQRTVLQVLDGLLAKRNGAGDNNGRGRKEAVA